MTIDQPGFQVIPRRWVVERTFGWFNTYRRLSKDYDYIEQVVPYHRKHG